MMVDEFQDTNLIQYQLIRQMVERHRNICVVGDDDQSIYRWRGAEVGNILNFEKDFPETKVITLEQNYRSTQNILQAANHMVRRNRLRKEKVLWTENPEGELLTLYVAEDEADEARFVVKKIMEQIHPSDSSTRTQGGSVDLIVTSPSSTGSMPNPAPSKMNWSNIRFLIRSWEG